MKKICILFLVVALSLQGYGQDRKIEVDEHPKDVKIQSPSASRTTKDDMREVIVRAFLTDTVKEYLAALPVNEAHLVSLAISFDSNGKVGSVYFPNKIANSLTKFLGPLDSLKYAITKALLPYTTYKDAVLLFPIIFHNADHKLINKYSFLREFINMWPDLSKEDDLKPFILLEPYSRWISIRY